MNKKRAVIFLGSLSVWLTPLLIGCESDTVSPPPEPAKVQVLVVSEADREPIAGIKVIPMDVAAHIPLASAQLSDELGLVEFELSANADLRFLAFGGLDWQVHAQEDWQGWPADRSDDVAVIRMRPPRPENGLPSIAGTVVDADTGEVLDQVFISTTPFLVAYSGRYDPGADVTLPDGAFTVYEIAFVQDFDTGNLTQVDLLFVGRAGYRTRTWVYRHAPGDNNVEITGVEIPLTALSAADDGVLTGRLLLQGEVAPNVTVGLSRIDNDDDKNGVGAPGFVATTDAAGRYTFTGLAAGQYLLHPGFRLYDGILPRIQPVAAVEVTNGSTTEAGDLAVAYEIRSTLSSDVSLAPGTASLLLSWSEVPAATSYIVRVGGQAIANSATPTFDLPIPADIPPGLYYWDIAAISADQETIGYMQDIAWFRMLEE